MPMFGQGLFRRGRWATARARRRIAAFGVALLLAAQVFSAAYLTHEADHDCTGHDCPVCLDLQRCVANFHLLGAGTAPAPLAGTVCAAAFESLEPVRDIHPAHPTLVSLKVRFDE